MKHKLGDAPIEWRSIPSLEGYEASEDGRIRSLDRVVHDKNGRRSRLMRGRILRLQKNGNGFHYHVRIAANGSMKTWLVHTIIALVFIGPRPNGQEVRHKNCDGFDNHRDNILYGSRSENRQDSIACGTIEHGETHHSAKLTETQVRKIKAADCGSKPLGLRYGVSRRTIDRIRSGDGWKHVIL